MSERLWSSMEMKTKVEGRIGEGRWVGGEAGGLRSMKMEIVV